MTCPKCRAANPAGQKFCGECGAHLAPGCAACGAFHAPGQKYCGACGAALTQSAETAKVESPQRYTPKHLAEKILTSKSALEGERKQVTVLFADLEGSMELLADRDPGEARKILDPVLEQMMEAVHRYEGTVHQVMGDGIMALFGAPLAHEDHAVRACYAALRMQESVKRYAEDARRAQGVNVQVRVGLNSGEVVVRAIGSDLHMDYTAVGQTTHLAARMEQLAIPGTILLTPSTLEYVEGYVAVKSLGPVPVKGLPDAVDVYELTGVGPARTRLHAAARRGLARLIGRDAELEQLRRAQQLAAHGHGQVVAVVGEAGVGKSRLLYELTHSHRLQGWLVLEAASVSYGKSMSYLPVIDLLKGSFRIQDRDDLREIRAKVTGKLLTLDEALKPTLPALLALLDVPVDDAAWRTLDPGQRRQQTLDAVKRLLLREAREQPLLLICEDLHWTDSETQALLNGLIESLASARILLLVSYRPDYGHGWGSTTSYSQIRLDALPAESAAELLEELLGDDPGLVPLKELLVKRGNPFFLEETVRTLVETKALAGERGRCRLMQPIKAIQVPLTVQAMLAARIDRLPPEDKRLLQVASVVGKDVPFTLLQAIADLTDEALRRGLDHLQAAEFLYETGLYPDLEYAFTHALTHEVTYGGLLQERRCALHARLVDAIETLGPDRLGEKIERLAHHAVHGEQWSRAVTYLREAGRKAARRSANRDAVASFEQALAALEHLPPTRERSEHAIDVRLDLGHALTPLGQVHQTLEHLGAAEVLAVELDDRPRLGRVTSFMTRALVNAGRSQEALGTGERALAIAHELDDRPLRIATQMYIARARLARGECAISAAVCREIIDLLDKGPADDLLGLPILVYAFVGGNLAAALGNLGAFAEAEAHAREAARRADVSGQAHSIVWALWGAGSVALARGHADDAIRVFDRALSLCRTHDLDVYVSRILAGVGCAQARAGHVTEGLSCLEQAVELDNAAEFSRTQTLALTELAEAYFLAGALEHARTTAHAAIHRARTYEERGIEGYASWVLAMTESAPEGDRAQAEAMFRAAVGIATDLGLQPLLAHCWLGLGALYAERGRGAEAEDHRSRGEGLLRTLDMRAWVPFKRLA